MYKLLPLQAAYAALIYLTATVLNANPLIIEHANTPASLVNGVEKLYQAEPQAATSTSDYSQLFVSLPTAAKESKYLQKISEAPGWVSIITAEEIRLYGFRSLVEILGSVPGFYVSDDRAYPSIGVRGYGAPDDFSTRILLMLDGLRINDGGLLDTASIGRHFLLDIDLIDRIEISRGPGSALYGNNALTAVINVISKRGRDLDYSEVAVSAAGNSTWEARATTGRRVAGSIEYLASVSRYDSAGASSIYFSEYDTPEQNNGVAENGDGETDSNINLKLAVGNFTLHGAFSERAKTVPTGVFNTVFNDTGNGTTDTGYFLNLAYDVKIGDNTNLHTDIFAQRQDYEGRSRYFDDIDNTVLNYFDQSDNDWWGTQSQVTFYQLEKHKLIAGMDFRHATQLGRKQFDDEFVFLDDDRSAWNWGLYVQDQYLPRNDLQFFTGVRYDKFKNSIGKATPRLGMVYSPQPNTEFKLLYSSAFRAPNTYESYSQQDEDPALFTRTDLDPEFIDTYEVVAERTIGDHWLTVANLFYSELDNLIGFFAESEEADFLLVNQPGTIRTKGIDLAFEGRTRNAIRAHGSVTWQRTTDSLGFVVPNSPRLIAKAGLIYPLMQDKLLIAGDFRFVGERDNYIGQTLNAYNTVNLTLTAPDLVKGLDLSLSVYNLFDARYKSVVTLSHLQRGIEQDGRNWRLKLAYKF